MPFGFISDELCTNRKFRLLLSWRGGREALGLWTVADSWCNAQLTDGHVPAYMIDQLGGWKIHSAELLVKAGLWREVSGGYIFHDWEDFNSTRDEVLRRRAEDASRKKHSRTAKRNSKAYLRSVSDADSAQTPPGVQSESTMESRAPDPSPIPSSSLRSEERETASSDAGSLTLTAPVSEPAKKAPSRPTAASQAKTALRAAVDRLATSYGHLVAPTASKAHWQMGAAKVQALAASGPEMPEAAERVARAAFEHLRSRKSSSFGYALQDCVIGSADSSLMQSVGGSDVERNSDGSIKLQKVGHSW